MSVDRDAVGGEARQHAGILAEQSARPRLDRARQRQAGSLGDRLDQRAPHAPAGAGHDQPHVGHCFRSFRWLLATVSFDDDQIGFGLALPKRLGLLVFRRTVAGQRRFIAGKLDDHVAGAHPAFHDLAAPAAHQEARAVLAERHRIGGLRRPCSRPDR